MELKFLLLHFFHNDVQNHNLSSSKIHMLNKKCGKGEERQNTSHKMETYMAKETKVAEGLKFYHWEPQFVNIIWITPKL